MDTLSTAAALFSAIEGKDPQAVAALYADDVEVWHNFSNACQTKTENLAVLTGLCESVPEIRYEVLEKMLLEDGRVLQRHNLRASTGSGEEVVIPACIFLTIQDGLITRIDEYLDTAQANRLRSLSGREAIGA
jgi:ketosteroid isomerase-like protein